MFGHSEHNYARCPRSVRWVASKERRRGAGRRAARIRKRKDSGSRDRSDCRASQFSGSIITKRPPVHLDKRFAFLAFSFVLSLFTDQLPERFHIETIEFSLFVNLRNIHTEIFAFFGKSFDAINNRAQPVSSDAAGLQFVTVW